jgi:putative hydrolase of the HAD superfamily
MLRDKNWRGYITPLLPIPSGMGQRGMPTGRLHCMLFDIYGTLLISGSGDIGTVKTAKRNFGQIEQLLKKYQILQSPQQLLDDFFSAIESEHRKMRRKGIEYPEVDVLKIWQVLLDSIRFENLREFAMQFEIITNPVYPMPHLEELLAACRRVGIKMGIISNAQFYTPILFEYFLKATLSKIGFDPDLTVFSYREGRAKPSSDLFEKVGVCLDQKHISRSSSLYIGNDMLNDIKPAQKAGFQTALYAGDARSLRLRKDDLRCKGISANMIVNDLLQLIEFLTKQSNV